MSGSETATAPRMIGINGLEFEVDQPYKEGHVLNAGEASAFNQLYEENIRNNLREKIKKMVEEGKPQTEMQELVDKYCEEYEVGGTKRGGRRIHDPVLRETRNIAIEAIKPLVAKQGGNWGNLSPDDKEALIKRYLDKYGEQAKAAAVQRLETLKSITSQNLDF